MALTLSLTLTDSRDRRGGKENTNEYIKEERERAGKGKKAKWTRNSSGDKMVITVRSFMSLQTSLAAY